MNFKICVSQSLDLNGKLLQKYMSAGSQGSINIYRCFINFVTFKKARRKSTTYVTKIFLFNCVLLGLQKELNKYLY